MEIIHVIKLCGEQQLCETELQFSSPKSKRLCEETGEGSCFMADQMLYGRPEYVPSSSVLFLIKKKGGSL